MNTNFLQTLMTVLILLSSFGTSILLGFGCIANPITGAVDCSTSNAPVWLAPYLVFAATGLGIVKMIVAAFEGKLTKPTVAVPAGKEAVIINKAPSQ